jgi:hypothetical protein
MTALDEAREIAKAKIYQWDNHDRFREPDKTFEPDGVKLARAFLAVDAEAAPFRPMSIEDCEAALDAIDDEDCKPMTPEQIEHGVKYATDADYRADYLKERFNEQLRINRGLRADLLARSACDGEGERDAERYRWIAENADRVFAKDMIWTWDEAKRGVRDTTLDAAIDAARKGVGG